MDVCYGMLVFLYCVIISVMYIVGFRVYATASIKPIVGVNKENNFNFKGAVISDVIIKMTPYI